MGQGRTFAGNDQQHIGVARAHLHQHVQQEIDILFEGDATYMH